MSAILFVSGCLLGALVFGFLWMRERTQLRTQLAEALAETKAFREKWEDVQKARENDRRVRDAEKEREKADREALQNASRLEFRELANRIFEEKSKRFTETNKESVEALLKPLNEHLESFQKTVRETKENGIRERASLKRQIEDLVRQTQNVSNEASNLAKALKGDAKVQGDWGEMVLSTILERSGLQKGVHYFEQESVKMPGGRNGRLDVLLRLPDKRSIIIDSKVSLTAYERFLSADDTATQEAARKEHLQSVKKHIDELAVKKYEETQSDTLDFVMLFMPVETAYLLAMQTDPNLWNYAYQKHILMISPTNLVACIKLIADIWRREAQSKNAEEIARQGELLYNKFIGFAESFEKIGSGLKGAQAAYDKALGQLKTGQGNLTVQAQKLVKLGVKTDKSLPRSLEDADFSEK
jgi:DNA recombination protein RmuC